MYDADSTNLGNNLTFWVGSKAGKDEEEGWYNEGFLYDVIENGGNREAVIQICHKQFVNLMLVEPFSGEEYEVRVPPGKSVTVVKKVVDLS